MVSQMRQMIRRYGSAMTLSQGGQDHAIRAFLQDTRSKSKENARREFSPLGENFRGRHIYIGPAEPMAAVGDILKYQGRIFELRRAEPVAVGDEIAYCWGLCIEKGAEGNWGE